MFKYPRTTHIRGSRKQPGDEDLKDIPFRNIQNKFLVICEKVDGANSGISFDNKKIILQSRGHILSGGYREKQFNLLKAWAISKTHDLWEILGNQYIMYGEWMFAKHTEFYDSLLHYFLEFDIFDKKSRTFLSAERRQKMLLGSGIQSVPILYQGSLTNKEDLLALIGPSRFKSDTMKVWKNSLTLAVKETGMDLQQVEQETDMSLMMEGLYIKIESNEIVLNRHKFVRSEFIIAVADSETHWTTRPILPNRLAEGVKIF